MQDCKQGDINNIVSVITSYIYIAGIMFQPEDIVYEEIGKHSMVIKVKPPRRGRPYDFIKLEIDKDATLSDITTADDASICRRYKLTELVPNTEYKVSARTCREGKASDPTVRSFVTGNFLSSFYQYVCSFA